MTKPKVSHKASLLALYRAPFGVSLVDYVAEQLLQRYQDNLAMLGEGVIYLPTRRAVNGLRQSFLALSHSGAQKQNFILPTMIALGDVAMDALEEGLMMTHQNQPENQQNIFEMADPIQTHLRLLMLAKIILTMPNFEGNHGQALHMAQSLARLLDKLQIAGKEIDDLDKIQLEGDYATHWQKNATFLKGVLRKQWRDYLKETNKCDVVEHNNRMLHLEGEKIELGRNSQMPQRWYLAVGSTASRPAVAEFLATIMQSTNGEVVLPGYIAPQNDAEMEAVLKDAMHPQYILYQNIKAWGANPELPLWGETTQYQEVKLPYLQEIFRTSKMLLPEQSRKKMANYIPEQIKLIEAESTWQEANIIALMIRQGIEQKEKTLLVTADDDLARLVVSLMKNRYDIDLEFTQGLPLVNSVSGRYLLMLTRAWQENFKKPESLLPLWQHPFSCFGIARIDALQKLRLMQYKARKKIGDNIAYMKLREEFMLLLDIKPMEAKHRMPLRKWLDGLIELLANCSKDADKQINIATEEIRAFQHEDGIACLRLLEKLRVGADEYPPLDAENFYQLLRFFLEVEIYRPQREFYPEIAILGTLESRMQHGASVILGGMREGAWPRAPQQDLWFNRAMLETLGLPPRQITIGQSAHDFLQLLSAPKLFITLPQKVNGLLVNESRFITRLKLAFPKWAEQQKVEQGNDAMQWREWADKIYHSQHSSPLTTPPHIKKSNVMPDKVSVTQLEILLKNPYGFYAKHILRLRALPHFHDDAKAMIWGNLVHRILDNDDMSMATLSQRADKIIADEIEGVIKQKLVRVRVENILEFVAEQTQDLQKNHHECSGEVKIITQAGNEFLITGKADSIQSYHGGKYHIVDYKTGGVPSKTERIEDLLAPQLPLLGLILQTGEFKDMSQGLDAVSLDYWQVKTRKKENKITQMANDKDDVKQLIQDYREKITALWDDYQQGTRAFKMVVADDEEIDKEITLKYNDYEHLARQKEWWGR